MALHKDFPKDPYVILDPKIRWFPADEDLREKGAIQKLLPPLVAGLREKVTEWRDKNYDGATDTSKAQGAQDNHLIKGRMRYPDTSCAGLAAPTIAGI